MVAEKDTELDPSEHGHRGRNRRGGWTFRRERKIQKGQWTEVLCRVLSFTDTNIVLVLDRAGLIVPETEQVVGTLINDLGGENDTLITC